MDAYLWWVADFIPTVLNSTACSIFLKDEESGTYVLKYTSERNPLKRQIGQLSYKFREGLTGWVLFTGDALRVNDIENEKELRSRYPGINWVSKHSEHRVRYFMAAPIKTPQETYGAIRLTRKAGGLPFTEEDEGLLNKYGRFLGESLRTLQLEEHGTMLVKPKWKARYSIKKNSCFVLMPFSTEWSDNVRLAIRSAVRGQKLKFKIADESLGRDIMPDVWRGICEARIIVADLSASNPNVAYEVGMADVLGKEMILLAQDPKTIPIDFAGARLLLYHVNRMYELRNRLSGRIAQILKQRP
jgi:hypothetical protein